MNQVYSKEVIEFVTVAAEYCLLVERNNEFERSEFVDRALKLMPLLYLKGRLLPRFEQEEEVLLEQFVTEEYYGEVMNGVADLLGVDDDYLDTFHPDMPLSDAPVLCHISETLADVYQDLKDCLGVYSQGHEESMAAALAQCVELFQSHWGQGLLNGMKALHALPNIDEEES